MPDDLKYLAVVESSLRPTAVSSAERRRACGSSSRGRGGALKWTVTSVIDERMDVFKATDGAMQYLRRLYNLFNDWPLALAAYNAGEGRVLDELREQGGRHLL